MRVSSPFSSRCNVVRAEHIEDAVHEEDVLSEDLTKLRRNRRSVIEPASFEAGLNAFRSFEEGPTLRSDLPDDLGGDKVRLRGHLSSFETERGVFSVKDIFATSVPPNRKQRPCRRRQSGNAMVEVTE